MKLKELLNVIPDDYKLGLMEEDVDSYATMVFGNKNDIICGFAQRAGMSIAHVKNLHVVEIHPGVIPSIPDNAEMYGEDSVELHVKTLLLIIVSTEEEENK